jgi:predicted hydrocarbon binding protein
MRGAPEPLKHVEQGEVEMVEFEHEADVRCGVDECDFIALMTRSSQTLCAKGPFSAYLTNCLRRQTK